MSTTTTTATAEPAFLTENRSAVAKIAEFRDMKITGKTRNLIGAGLAVGGLAVIGMVGMNIIVGATALVVSVVAGGAMLYGIRFMKTFDPYIRQKWKNTRLEMMVKEARERDIYQLDNEVMRRADKLVQARAMRDQAGAQIESLKAGLRDDHLDEEERAHMREVIVRVEKAYGQILVAVDRMAEDLQAFKKEVAKHKRLKAFNEKAKNIASVLSSTGAAEELERMLSLEAFRSISTGFDEALITVENLSRDAAIDGQ